MRSPAAVSRTARVTSAPAAASARAVSTPMPDAPPVTIARLPARSMPAITSAAVDWAPKGVVMGSDGRVSGSRGPDEFRFSKRIRTGIRFRFRWPAPDTTARRERAEGARGATQPRAADRRRARLRARRHRRLAGRHRARRGRRRGTVYRHFPPTARWSPSYRDEVARLCARRRACGPAAGRGARAWIERSPTSRRQARHGRRAEGRRVQSAARRAARDRRHAHRAARRRRRRGRVRDDVAERAAAMGVWNPRGRARAGARALRIVRRPAPAVGRAGPPRSPGRPGRTTRSTAPRR